MKFKEIPESDIKRKIIESAFQDGFFRALSAYDATEFLERHAQDPWYMAGWEKGTAVREEMLQAKRAYAERIIQEDSK